jgi:hypothetical protein
MNLRSGILPLLFFFAACSSPEPKQILRESIDLGVPNATALCFALQGSEKLADLLVCTPLEADGKAAAVFMEKVSQLGYRVLWIRAEAPANAAAAAALLNAGAGQAAGPGKKGLMVFGEWPGSCPGLSDSAFQAVIWVTAPAQVQTFFAVAADSASHHPQLALIVPAQETVNLTPELRTWLRSAENLIWLATDRTPVQALNSDLEPIVRRKAQMFFDRHLKGKR